ncbi:gonadotropin-releasing hormone II receptor-like [Sinocyclocheilus anshuiensis]|uniref:gonadotropin-releasing hormone II receptor-like n=1 Tax=Sinocyclocheilus anshuiensis TaxID=1608454 RepID=UPI0007B8F2FC|nr:PREDICTED: gonadotropin-releasing hormone II receptor-like [Sinocyclocheilus anshuiensis]
MNDSSPTSENIMFHQLTADALNGSCDYTLPTCNNSTGEAALQLPTFSMAAKVRVIITFTLCAVSAVCNLSVLWAASTNNKRKSHVRILIMNLTVADLLVTFIVMPVDAAWNITVQWLAGDLACRLLMFLKLVAMYSCAFVTVVISLDRQSAILNPLAINKAKKKNKIMLSVAWVMSVVLSVPQMFLFHNVTITVPANFTQCTTRGHLDAGALNALLSSKEVHLRRSNSNIPKARMRTLKMSIVIVTSFIVCWTPYYLLGLWYWFLPEDLEETVSHSLTHILFIFGLFNAILDPITYGLFTIHFRKGLKRYCRNVVVLTESENNSIMTGSLKCSPSPFRMKRVTQTGPGANPEKNAVSGEDKKPADSENKE